MRFVQMSLIVLWCVRPGSTLARSLETAPLEAESIHRSSLSGGLPAELPTEAPDTLRFGYYTMIDGQAYAVEHDTWTWDHGSVDPQEGWTSIDLTGVAPPRFRQINPAVWHSDPLDPSPPPVIAGIGSAWLGLFESEARDLCWTGGLGYGNDWCQRLDGPTLTYTGHGSVNLSFRYFNDTEPGYDYTRVILEVGQISKELNSPGFTGPLGAYNSPGYFSRTISNTELGGGNAPRDFRVVLLVATDGTNSDEDGGYPTPYGPFGLDDVTIGGSVAGGPRNYTFESDLQGWTGATCPRVGSFFGVADLAQYTLPDPYGCALYGRVAEFHQGLGNAGTHPDGQHEIAWSPVVDRSGLQQYRTVFARWDAFVDLPLANGILYRPGWSYYPYTCPITGATGWSPRAGRPEFYFSNTPWCLTGTDVATDLGIPAECDLVHFGLEVYRSCQAFNIPPEMCTGLSNPSPLVDNVYVGMTGAPGGETCAEAIPIGALPYFDLRDTGTMRDDYPPGSQQCGNQDPLFGLGPDVVYRFEISSPPDGPISFFAEPRDDWNVVCYAFEGECSPGHCVAWSDQGGPGRAEVMSFPVLLDTPYYVVVDGHGGEMGQFAMQCYSGGSIRCLRMDGDKLGRPTPPYTKKEGTDSKAETNASNRVVPISDCHREWNVPSPDSTETGDIVTVGIRRNTMINDLGYKNAVAHVMLSGSYLVRPKPEDGDKVKCEADYRTWVAWWLRTSLRFGVVDFNATTHVNVDPFFPFDNKQEVWKGCRTNPGSQENVLPCDESNAVRLFGGPVQRDVTVNVPHSIFLSFAAVLGGTGNAWGDASIGPFRMDIQCPDPPPSGTPEDADPPGAIEGTGKPGREVIFQPLSLRVERAGSRQDGNISVPPGFAAGFIEADSLGDPIPLEFGGGGGFEQGLYLAGLITPFDQMRLGAVRPDIRRVYRCSAGSPARFGADSVYAPSDLRFSRGGGFGHKLYTAAADSFDDRVKAPLDGHGTIVAIDSSGAVTTLASRLHSPVALAFAPGAPWDGNLYVAEIDTGLVTRVTPGGLCSTFVAGLTMPIDLKFAGGAFGTGLYVAEADTLEPVLRTHPNSGRIRRISSDGSVSSFARPLQAPSALAYVNSAGPFGEYLYVAQYNQMADDTTEIPLSGSIVRVSPTGSIETFATGLEEPMRLAFRSPDTLYVAVHGGIVKIFAQDPASAPPAASFPGTFRLLSASPNPMGLQTSIRFDLPRPMDARLDLFDASGALRCRIASGFRTAGRHEIAWKGVDGRGNRLSSGIYFLRLTGEGGASATSRMVLVK